MVETFLAILLMGVATYQFTRLQLRREFEEIRSRLAELERRCT